jgi:hypothetical protein
MKNFMFIAKALLKAYHTEIFVGNKMAQVADY